jgi:hypothetical protein
MHILLFTGACKEHTISKKGGSTMPKKPGNAVKASVFLSQHIYEKLQTLATEKGTTVSGLARQIIIEFFTKKE